MATGWAAAPSGLPAGREPVAARARERRSTAREALPGRHARRAQRAAESSCQRHRLPVSAQQRFRLADGLRRARRGADRAPRRRGRALPRRPRQPEHVGVLHRPPLRRAMGRAPARCKETAAALGMACRPLDELDHALDALAPGKTRVLRNLDSRVDRKVRRAGDKAREAALAVASSELRLVEGPVRGRRTRAGDGRHRAGLRRVRREIRPRTTGPRRALDRGHVQPPRPARGQRRGLWQHLRLRPARDDPALGTQRRPGTARRAAAARHRRRIASSTPPTSPAHCLSAGGSATQRRSTRLCWPRSAGHPKRGPARTSSTRTAPPWKCSRKRCEEWGILDVPAAQSLPGGAPVCTGAGHFTAPRTCSAWTCTTAPPPATRHYRRGRSRRAWCSRSSRAVLPARRPARPRRVPGDRRAHRGRRRGDRGWLPGVVGGAASLGGRRGGMGARAAELSVPTGSPLSRGCPAVLISPAKPGDRT